MKKVLDGLKRIDRNINKLRDANIPSLLRLEQLSKSYCNQFMNIMLSRIKEDDHHPLKFLIENGKWKGRIYLKVGTHPLAMQAGHQTTRVSRAEEFFALEDAFFNQGLNWSIESTGITHFRNAINIKGVPVERMTALNWVEMSETALDGVKFFSRETFINAQSTPGWSPLGLLNYKHCHS